MRVRIAQCLCGPARHAIIALAVNEPDMPDEEVRALLQCAVEEALAGRGAALGLPTMNGWCGLCGAKPPAWRYEIGWSREFDDWEHAERYLRENADDQGATAALLNLLDLSYDARLRKRGVTHN